MVSAEFALALPAVVVLTAGLLGGLALGIDQLRCIDAAAAAARSSGRGDPWVESTQLAGRVGPSGATVRGTTGERTVTVTVSVERSIGPGRWFGPITLSASATAAREVVQ